MKTLECPIHECTDTLAGTFTYEDASGVPDAAAFYVRCEPHPSRSNPDCVAISERREEAANDQLTEMWKSLLNRGFQHVTYKQVEPDPFF